MPSGYKNTIEGIAARTVEEPGPLATPCWIWQGACNAKGYGKVGYGGAAWLVHRLLYTHLVGPIPAGLEPDHTCKRKACARPDHLELVTHRENILRGDSPIAKHARQTHCKRGHEFTPENTAPVGEGGRRCKTCASQWGKDRHAREYVPKPPRPLATHCTRGHAYTPANSVPLKSGGRRCRTCAERYSRERYLRTRVLV